MCYTSCNEESQPILLVFSADDWLWLVIFLLVDLVDINFRTVLLFFFLSHCFCSCCFPSAAQCNMLHTLAMSVKNCLATTDLGSMRPVRIAVTLPPAESNSKGWVCLTSVSCVWLAACLCSVCLSICPSACPSVCPSVCLSALLCVLLEKNICLSICSSIYPHKFAKVKTKSAPVVVLSLQLYVSCRSNHQAMPGQTSANPLVCVLTTSTSK